MVYAYHAHCSALLQCARAKHARSVHPSGDIFGIDCCVGDSIGVRCRRYWSAQIDDYWRCARVSWLLLLQLFVRLSGIYGGRNCAWHRAKHDFRCRLGPSLRLAYPCQKGGGVQPLRGTDYFYRQLCRGLWRHCRRSVGCAFGSIPILCTGIRCLLGHTCIVFTGRAAAKNRATKA